MSEAKTTCSGADVGAYLDRIEPAAKRDDSLALSHLMQEATGEAPALWGDNIVGFGSYHYRYASGREGDWPLVGFSPRKQQLTLYLMDGFEHDPELLARLGTFKTGKACLYVKRLADVDLDVLRDLIVRSVGRMRAADAAS
jgi:hypothetical protein